jgi:dolichol-phosphate mannosyltransferase
MPADTSQHLDPSGAPSAESAEARQRWRLRAAWLIGGVTLLRILIIATTGLADGETYYYLWSRFPALSYYDHPPLVAWMTWLTTRFSHDPVVVHSGPVLCATIFLVLLYRLSEKLFSARAAFLAVAVISTLPAFIFTGFVLNPESPLAPLWVLALLILESMRHEDEAWLVPVALLYLAASHASRRWFRRPSLYLGGVVALLAALPVIIWNQQHQWASLTLHFVERAAPPNVAGTLHTAFQTLVGQFVAFQPMVFPGLLAALVLAVRRSAKDDRYRFLALTSGPVLLFFFITMVRVRDAESHWTMVGYMPLAIAAGAWLDEVLERLPSLVRWYLWASFAVSTAVTLVLWSYAVSHFLPRFVPPSAYDANRDFFNEMEGWDQIQSAVAEGVSALGPGTVVASTQYALCAHLLSALDDRPNVYCPTPGRTEFDFLARHDPPAGVPVVFINNDHYAEDPTLLLPSRSCRALPTVSVERAGRVLQHYHVYGCPPAGSHELIVPRGLPAVGAANDRSG